MTSTDGYTGSTLDHLNISVTDHPAARTFYDAVLPTVGVERLLDFPATADRPAMTGYGVFPKPFLWLVAGERTDDRLHLALTAGSRDEVEAFHVAALAAGAVEREAPAVHPEYHGDYFGGFVTGPDGVNLEAVCHRPPGTPA